MGVCGTQSLFVTCDLFNGNHSSDCCPLNSESVQYVNNFNRQQNTLYSNYYNAGWKNHHNFSWSNNQGSSSSSKPMFPWGFPSQIQPQEKISGLEEAMLKLVNNTNQFMIETKTQL